MSPFALWLLIGGIAIGTFILRLSFIHLLAHVDLSPLAERALRFVPPAVLAVLVVPALVSPDNALNLSLANDRLWAGLVAAGAAWGTRSVVVTLAVGMGTLWMLQSVAPT
jgi:branched-subunit amino acid transport protein